MVGKDTVGHPAQVISKTFTVLRQSCPKRLEKLPSHTLWKEGNFPWTTNTQATEFWVGFINESVSTKWNKKLLPKFRPETSAKIQTSRSSNPTQPNLKAGSRLHFRWGCSRLPPAWLVRLHDGFTQMDEYTWEAYKLSCAKYSHQSLASSLKQVRRTLWNVLT